MPPRTSLRFASTIAAAAACPKTPNSRVGSPSSSELSSPPASSPEPETSEYFRKQPRRSGKRDVKKPKLEQDKPIKRESERNIKPEHEPAPSLGDIPELLTSPSLPPPPSKSRVKRPKKEETADDASVFPDPSLAPPNWEKMYSLVLQSRRSIPAPVDTMGCATLHDPKAPAIDQRFHTLVSLMLSSQTKDTVTAPTVRNLQTSLPGGLTVASILATPPQTLNDLICKVGFHRRKTEYILAAAKILRDEYNGDIPDTVEGLMKLPGVGPKMAHLCMTAAWGKTMGIGVDVHVHRICNLWGWVKNAKTPEDTRMQLEKWLPKDKWAEINWLLVGFGQTVCLPRGRKCGECPLSNGLCRAAFKGDVAKGQKALAEQKRGRRAKEEEESDGDGEEMEGESGEEYVPEGKRKTRAARQSRKEAGKVKKEEDSEEEKMPRKRPRRTVKVEVKMEDGWRERDIGDIEDLPVVA